MKLLINPHMGSMTSDELIAMELGPPLALSRAWCLHTHTSCLKSVFGPLRTSASLKPSNRPASKLIPSIPSLIATRKTSRLTKHHLTNLIHHTITMFRQQFVRQVRLFSTTPIARKSPVETVKDAAKAIDRTISGAAVKGIEKGGTYTPPLSLCRHHLMLLLRHISIKHGPVLWSACIK
jgi:hypothetical protein